jgi:hypothetical protein
MKYFATILILAFFAACSSNSKKKDNFITYFDKDQLPKEYSAKESLRVDSLFRLDNDSIIHYPVIIDSIKYYVVEGDLLLNEYEYFQYKLSSIMKMDSTTEVNALVGEIRDGQIVRWPENHLIKYCIARNSFSSLNSYQEVRENLKAATKEWEKTCNVKFVYEEAKDQANILTPTDDLTFVAMGYNSNGRFIASAFFPYEPANKRRILIDPTYFTTGFDKVGVLRHELGHTIGFRHEHIRGDAPKVCQGEDLTGTISLTGYDPKSVMHYFCGGMGSIKLEITDVDREGSQSVYGPPKN